MNSLSFFLKKLCRPDDPSKNNYSTVSSIVLDYLPTDKEHFSFQARQRHGPRPMGCTASMGSAAQRKQKRMIRFIEK